MSWGCACTCIRCGPADQHDCGTIACIPPADTTCPKGYTVRDIMTLLDDRFPQFSLWIPPDAMTVCTGQRYDWNTLAYIPDECGTTPHGVIYYRSYVENFTSGR